MIGRLVEVRDETPLVKTFVFELEERVTFLPGQFFMFWEEENKGCRRAYSVSSTETKNVNKISITLNEVPNGNFSRVLFSARSGDVFQVDGPYGKFVYDSKGSHVVLVGGGTGIAPLRCILMNALSDGKKVTLVYSVRTPEEIIFKEEFLSLGKKMVFIPTVTDGKGSEWNGRYGRVDRELLKECMRTGDEVFYVCGSPDMVRDLRKCLLELGVPEGFIKREQW